MIFIAGKFVETYQETEHLARDFLRRVYRVSGKKSAEAR